MSEINRIDEDLDDVNTYISDELDSDNVELDNNNSSSINQKKQTIVQFGDYARVRFLEGDPNIFLEKRTRGKVVDNIDNVDDPDNVNNVGTKESYSNDCYPSTIENVIKHVLARNIAEKILKKDEIKDLLEIRDIIKQSNNEIKIMAREIVNAIRNNECLVDITKEALERSDRHSK